MCVEQDFFSINTKLILFRKMFSQAKYVKNNEDFPSRVQYWLLDKLDSI